MPAQVWRFEQAFTRTLKGILRGFKPSDTWVQTIRRVTFDRYNIVNEADIKDGMCKAEQYIRAQRGHNLGTIDELPTKKGVNQ